MTHNLKFLVPITAPDEMRKICEIISRVVRHASELEVLLIKQAGWVAVPVESHSHITLLNEEQLQQLLLVRGYQHLFAVALEPLEYFPPVLIVPATVKGINEFRLNCDSYYFALFAGEPDWVIIHTVDEFDIITGSADFVNQLLGCDPKEALERFKEHAEDFPIVPMKVLRELLLSIHSYFQDNYPVAEIGSEFTVIKQTQ